MNRKERLSYYFLKAKKLVIKVGSAVITQEDLGLNYEVLENIVKEISKLKQKYKIILVSSGAIACGRLKLKYYKKQLSLSEKQALAAVGQATLIQAYEELFEKYQIKVAQVLLTSEDLSHRTRYLNAKSTLQTLLKWDIIPIVNENDTVATEEIKFGDNDLLSALVTGVVEGDFLIILSDIDALYKEDPRENPLAEKISEVEKIGPEIFAMAGKRPGNLGRGGMYSKIKAAQMVTSMGIPMVILPGKVPQIIEKFFEGEEVGTIFWPQEKHLSLRKFWIKYYIKPEGRVYIDEGAEKALIDNAKSLLIGGVKKIEGEFSKGACVECLNLEGKSLAKGLINFSSKDLEFLINTKEKIHKEVIHRDNLVLLD